MVVTSVNDSLEKLMVGWREWVALPGLGIGCIKAKVDTGARSSALHTFELHAFEENGVAKVRFSIHPFQRNSTKIIHCVADLLDERYVTDSGGHREIRPVIRTPICMGDAVRDIEISLTNRESMKFRMLLGRTAICGSVIVDPSASYLLGKPGIGEADTGQNIHGEPSI